MDPQIRYARTSDDVSIAYWTYGQGPVLIEGPLMPFSHIEMEWSNPQIRRWYEKLGESVTVVRYDGRGNGLSQRDVEDVSLDGHVRDLEAVVAALGPDPVALMGVFHSGPGAIAYAARYPERVSHLILFCTYRTGAEYWRTAQSEGLRALRQTDYVLFLRAGAHELFGWSEDAQAAMFAEIMRASVNVDEADRLIAETRDFDLTESLTDLQCPTLVLHRRELTWLPIDLSRDLASRIPDSRLVVTDGDSPLPAAGNTEPTANAILRFLDVATAPDVAGAGPGEFRAVLFTDLVGHTQMMSALGDDRGRQVLRRHEEIIRGVLAEHDGTEVKSLGDGFMASFGSVTRSVKCAVALQERIAQNNASEEWVGLPSLTVRIGVNAGEPIEEEGDLFGASVILASRIAAAADGGDILVSNAVRELTAGKAFRLEDRGMIHAKGFEEPVHVWAVDWRG
jgi:class 3 adenylate cyclase/pimeloyl-ACP methyl ester carboxylesterase